MSGRDYKSVICSKNFSWIWSSGLNELSYGKLAESVSQKVPKGFCSISEHWGNRFCYQLNYFFLKMLHYSWRMLGWQPLKIFFVKIPKIPLKEWKLYQNYENTNWVKSCSKSSSGAKECSFENSLHSFSFSVRQCQEIEFLSKNKFFFKTLHWTVRKRFWSPAKIFSFNFWNNSHKFNWSRYCFPQNVSLDAWNALLTVLSKSLFPKVTLIYRSKSGNDNEILSFQKNLRQVALLGT